MIPNIWILFVVTGIRVDDFTRYVFFFLIRLYETVRNIRFVVVFQNVNNIFFDI